MSLSLWPKAPPSRCYPSRQAGPREANHELVNLWTQALLRPRSLWNKLFTWKAKNLAIGHHLVTKRIASLEASRSSGKPHEAMPSNLQTPVIVSSQRAMYRVFKSENIQDILAQWQTRNQTPLSKWAQNHQTHVYTFLSQNLCVWITSVCHAVFLLGPTCLPL